MIYYNEAMQVSMDNGELETKQISQTVKDAVRLYVNELAADMTPDEIGNRARKLMKWMHDGEQKATDEFKGWFMKALEEKRHCTKEIQEHIWNTVWRKDRQVLMLSVDNYLGDAAKMSYLTR